MKKITTSLLFIFCAFIANAQNNQTSIKENSLGVSFTFSTLSNGYDWGIGLIASEDFNSSGEGIGMIAHLTYLQPNDAISNIIEYAYTSDIMLKYDVGVTPEFQIGPTLGVGYSGAIAVNGSNPDADFYFLAGATSSYFLTDSVIIGFDITKYFLEGSDISIAASIRFNY